MKHGYLYWCYTEVRAYHIGDWLSQSSKQIMGRLFQSVCTNVLTLRCYVMTLGAENALPIV